MRDASATVAALQVLSVANCFTYPAASLSFAPALPLPAVFFSVSLLRLRAHITHDVVVFLICDQRYYNSDTRPSCVVLAGDVRCTGRG